MSKDKNQKKPVELPENYFQYDDRTFKVVTPKVNIPGLGIRTALEIVTDEDAQKWLVEENCIGSVIEEVEL